MKLKDEDLYITAVESLRGFLELTYCARKLLSPDWTADHAIKRKHEPVGVLLGALTEALESHDEALSEIIGCGEQLVAAGNLGAPNSSTTNFGPASTPEPHEILLRTIVNIQQLRKDNNNEEKNQWPKIVK